MLDFRSVHIYLKINSWWFYSSGEYTFVLLIVKRKYLTIHMGINGYELRRMGIRLTFVKSRICGTESKDPYRPVLKIWMMLNKYCLKRVIILLIRQSYILNYERHICTYIVYGRTVYNKPAVINICWFPNRENLVRCICQVQLTCPGYLKNNYYM